MKVTIKIERDDGVTNALFYPNVVNLDLIPKHGGRIIVDMIVSPFPDYAPPLTFDGPLGDGDDCA